MAKFKDLKLASKRFIKRYPFPELDAPKLTLPAKSIKNCKLALVTTAGLYQKEDKPFSDNFKDSDCSFRIIQHNADKSNLLISHTSGDFDRSGVQEDLNVAFPIDRIKELALKGTIGSIAERHYSFMGSLPRTGDLRNNTAPEVARMMKEESVDVALIAPV